ncbi:unnamed protein product [Amoebophrya sp. A25]|nr:unnamed protein product [Amoebophrya sp. A25]|eukprot:GSA25T00014658001.1
MKSAPHDQLSHSASRVIYLRDTDMMKVQIGPAGNSTQRFRAAKAFYDLVEDDYRGIDHGQGHEIPDHVKSHPTLPACCLDEALVEVPDARSAMARMDKSGGADLALDKSSSNPSSKDSVHSGDESGSDVQSSSSNAAGASDILEDFRVATAAVQAEIWRDGPGYESTPEAIPQGPQPSLPSILSLLSRSSLSPLQHAEEEEAALMSKNLLANSLGAKVQMQRSETPYGTPTFAFDGTIDDYSELCVMFGFLMLFSIALPLVGALIYAACLLEVSVDSFKFRHVIRRPMPKQALNGVGVWISILKSIAWVSVPTNACILVLTAQINKSDEIVETVGKKDVAAIFFIAFLLTFVKLVSAQYNSVKDRDFGLLIQRIESCMTRLILAHQRGSDGTLALGHEQTDFRIHQPYEFDRRRKLHMRGKVEGSPGVLG